jgi:nucleotide-binding universal stress UspA family protein
MNDRYDHLACFVDDSEASRLALRHARLLRDRLGATRLRIVHVVPPPVYFGVYEPPERTLPPAVPEWLKDLGTEVPGAEVVFVDTFSAYPPAEAVRWASSAGVDLAVAGSHRGIYERMALGGFAAYLAYHATCPVLLIPPPIAGR